MIRDARAVQFWCSQYAKWVFGRGLLREQARQFADADTLEFAKRFCTLDERVEVEDTLRRIDEGNVSDEQDLQQTTQP